MSLKHALLGFLNYSPMTGYELKKYFDSSVAHFWHAELSQIYPTLRRMKDEGLLEVEIKYNENAPPGKYYRLTPAGRAEFRRWLGEATELTRLHEAVLIKVFFGADMPRAELLRQLDDQRRRHQERLSLYRTFFEHSCEREDLDRRLKQQHDYSRLTLRAGILTEEAWIAWCDEAAAAVKRFPDNEEE